MLREAWCRVGGGALLLAAALPVSAQTATEKPSAAPGMTAQYLAETGLCMEIVGLRRWTATMLLDSLRARVPRQSLASSKLGFALKTKLGFAEASSWRLQGGDSVNTMLLAVIEPEDSAQVQWRAFTGDSARSIAPWTSLVSLVQTRSGFELLRDALEPLVISRVVGRSPTIPVPLRIDTTAVRQLWDTLLAHRRAEDLMTARQLLASAPNVPDRISAIAILSNFERDDAARHALVGALRDPDEKVRAFALVVLQMHTTQAPRRVDWRPASTDLHAILNGTSLEYLRDLLDVLLASGVTADLAGPLLHDGGRGVLIFVESPRADVRRSSYRFLRAISRGQSYTTAVQWQTWIVGLRS